MFVNVYAIDQSHEGPSHPVEANQGLHVTRLHAFGFTPEQIADLASGTAKQVVSPVVAHRSTFGTPRTVVWVAVPQED